MVSQKVVAILIIVSLLLLVASFAVNFLISDQRPIQQIIRIGDGEDDSRGSISLTIIPQPTSDNG